MSSHLTFLQGIITRLAGNSAGCKTWCVTAIWGVTLVSLQQVRPRLELLVTVSLLTFALLDAYYLCLERAYRACFSDMVA